MTTPSTLAAGLFREQAGRLTAQLLRRFGADRLADIEDAVQDALLAAMRSWAIHGAPRNPAAWLNRAARNALLDRLRHARFDAPMPEDLAGDAGAEPAEQLSADLLGLMFLCASPELPHGTQLALMLKLACGLGTAEIASVLLISEASTLQRIVRAKQVLRDAGTPLTFPANRDELAARVAQVAHCVYLLFAVGYFNTAGPRWSEPELCGDALRMARILADDDRTRSPETLALSALLCFSAARLPARGNRDQTPVPLVRQNRGLWLRPLIDEGFRRFDLAICGERLSRYHIEAAIAACHARAASLETTDWNEILSHYDQLCTAYPSPAASLNRLVALARARGSARALDIASADRTLQQLEGSSSYLATLGQLHEEIGAGSTAARYYRDAAAAAGSEPLAVALRDRALKCESR